MSSFDATSVSGTGVIKLRRVPESTSRQASYCKAISIYIKVVICTESLTRPSRTDVIGKGVRIAGLGNYMNIRIVRGAKCRRVVGVVEVLEGSKQPCHALNMTRCQ